MVATAGLCLVFLVAGFSEINAVCEAQVSVSQVKATAVNVSWTLPCASNVSEFHVLWMLHGLCSTTDLLSNLSIESAAMSHLLTGLEEYSNYSVYVDTEFSSESARGSLHIYFLTSQAAASSGPTPLTVSDTDRRPVRVEWGGIECSHRNGNITHYVVDITSLESDTESWEVLVEGDAESGGSYMVCGLRAGVKYNISVSAVNSLNQIGVPNTLEIMITQTNVSVEVGECRDPVQTAPQDFVVELSSEDPGRSLVFCWAPPAVPHSYWITYTLTCLSPGGKTVIEHNIESNRDEPKVPHTVNKLRPATTYTCSLFAYNSAGAGPAVHANITTEGDSETPAPPLKLKPWVLILTASVGSVCVIVIVIACCCCLRSQQICCTRTSNINPAIWVTEGGNTVDDKLDLDENATDNDSQCDLPLIALAETSQQAAIEPSTAPPMTGAVSFQPCGATKPFIDIETLYDDTLGARMTTAKTDSTDSEEKAESLPHDDDTAKEAVHQPGEDINEPHDVEESLYDDTLAAQAAAAKNSDTECVENILYADIATCKKEAEGPSPEHVYQDAATVAREKALITVEVTQYAQLSDAVQEQSNYDSSSGQDSNDSSL